MSPPLPIAPLLRAVALAAALAAFAGAAAASDALAPIAQGAKAAGRGGAGAAVADDALSGGMNPALLTELEGIRLDGSLMVIHERKTVVSGTGAGATSKASASTLPLPTLALSWDPLEEPRGDDDATLAPASSDLRIGFGLYQPYLAVFAPTVTIAYRVLPELSIGFSAQALLSRVTIDSVGGVGSNNSSYTPGGTLRVFRNPDGTPVNPPQVFDAGGGQTVTWSEVYDQVQTIGKSTSGGGPRSSIGFKLEDVFGAGVAAQGGLLWSPHEAVSIGLGGRSPGVIFRPKGEATIDFSSAVRAAAQTPAVSTLLDAALETYLPDAGAKGFRAQYDIEADRIILPPEVTLGLAVRPLDRLLLALDLKWIGWSHATREVEIRASGGTNADFNEINGGSSLTYRYKLDWKDQAIIAGGASVSATSWLTLRAGYRHGNDPVPSERVTANGLIITDHLTAGASIYVGAWDLDIAYVYGMKVEGEVPTKNATFAVDEHMLWLGAGVQF